uniref:NADH dehydrogenase subunit 5 n=1 Tax=Hemidactylus mandebensis TaxID=1643449 RepID=UPI0021B66FBB|nr:NADH dehydrogenase subunit 5 [Hemidactylus mandebensis]UVW80922.1 NADH dehydrogenase subunit 5 [Hemidactylus mandebensis]
MMMTLFHTTMLTTLATLALPLLTKRTLSPTTITTTVKLAFMQSLLPMLIFLNTGTKSITTNLCWAPTQFSMQISFLFDLYTTLFLPTALFITWAILEFTNWYMSTDPHLTQFTKYLLLFLIAMTTLTTANNMLQLFIGWEGVGVMSFLLIGWWHARASATTSALQAIVYNRTGDIGLILSMAWLAMNYNTWEIQHMFSHHTTPTLPLLGLVLAAMGKSAQFGLHPWLPAAMEGPTPVSALLHSSTMVVAGIFLLIRMHPLMATSTAALTLCLCLGALTTLFAALCALTQNDIKKIIAFSTSSQLGLMMLTIGLNQPTMAYLHIITHAFFKALLFLCSGSIIHNLNNEQDIRKMGNAQKTLPITSSCLTLGSLALMGTPFLAGFYTKDTIIETLTTSSLNAWALLTTIIATALTAAYSTRLIFYTHTGAPRQPTLPQAELNQNQIQPLLRLAAGSIIAGLLVTTTTTPLKPQVMTMPTSTKFAALAVTILGLAYSYDLMHHTAHLTPQPKSNKKQHTATTQLMFFNLLAHRATPTKNFHHAQTKALQLNDLLWYETLMPEMLMTSSTETAKNLSQLHTGNMKSHLAAFTTLTISTLIWLKYL